MSEDIKKHENEEVKIMKFLDEEGNKVQFEAVARIFLKEKEYLLLAPVEDKDSENVYVFRIAKEMNTDDENLAMSLAVYLQPSCAPRRTAKDIKGKILYSEEDHFWKSETCRF